MLKKSRESLEKGWRMTWKQQEQQIRLYFIYLFLFVHFNSHTQASENKPFLSWRLDWDRIVTWSGMNPRLWNALSRSTGYKRIHNAPSRVQGGVVFFFCFFFDIVQLYSESVPERWNDERRREIKASYTNMTSLRDMVAWANRATSAPWASEVSHLFKTRCVCLITSSTVPKGIGVKRSFLN